VQLVTQMMGQQHAAQQQSCQANEAIPRQGWQQQANSNPAVSTEEGAAAAGMPQENRSSTHDTGSSSMPSPVGSSDHTSRLPKAAAHPPHTAAQLRSAPQQFQYSTAPPPHLHTAAQVPGLYTRCRPLPVPHCCSSQLTSTQAQDQQTA
jgi:hypothetical protein